MVFETAIYNKVPRRLIPFLFACYILAYVDRVNIGFAKLQMQHDLGMSETVYGIGAGIFFIGYFRFKRFPVALRSRGSAHDSGSVASC